MDVVVVIIGLGALFAVGQFFISRKEVRLRRERRDATYSDFASLDSLADVPPLVSQAVFLEFLELHQTPPMPEDRLYEEHGIAGSDLDELIIRLSNKLRIDWKQERPTGASVRTVEDLMLFLVSGLGND